MIKLFILCLVCFINSLHSASIIATIDGKPITDIDITTYTKIMNLRGNVSLTNRNESLNNIINDTIKLNYAESIRLLPQDKDIEKEYKKINTSNLSKIEKQVLKNIIKTNIAWQMVIAKTIIPFINLSKEDINLEFSKLEKETGLPILMDIIRIINIPLDIYKKLNKPKNCNDAINIIKNLGGTPQKIQILQYELSKEIRELTVKLKPMEWSKYNNGTVILICKKEETKEYKQINNIVKQNALYKKAIQLSEKQLKQLNRKSIIIINDKR